jgi:hypothetical protein
MYSLSFASWLGPSERQPLFARPPSPVKPCAARVSLVRVSLVHLYLLVTCAMLATHLRARACWAGTPSSGGGFAPSQIAVLPMGWAMEDQSRTVAFLKERFPAARLDPSLVEGPTPTENDASGDSAHPSLEDGTHPVGPPPSSSANTTHRQTRYTAIGARALPAVRH